MHWNALESEVTPSVQGIGHQSYTLHTRGIVKVLSVLLFCGTASPLKVVHCTLRLRQRCRSGLPLYHYDRLRLVTVALTRRLRHWQQVHRAPLLQYYLSSFEEEILDIDPDIKGRLGHTAIRAMTEKEATRPGPVPS